MLKNYRQVGRWVASLGPARIASLFNEDWAVYDSEVLWPSLHPAAPGCLQKQRERERERGREREIDIQYCSNQHYFNPINT